MLLEGTWYQRPDGLLCFLRILFEKSDGLVLSDRAVLLSRLNKVPVPDRWVADLVEILLKPESFVSANEVDSRVTDQKHAEDAACYVGGFPFDGLGLRWLERRPSDPQAKAGESTLVSLRPTTERSTSD